MKFPQSSHVVRTLLLSNFALLDPHCDLHTFSTKVDVFTKDLNFYVSNGLLAETQ